MLDTLHNGPEVREKLMNGIRKAKEAVGVTMGTSGGNSIIEAIENPGHLLTNDGLTILQSIHFGDPIEQMGKNILLESVGRANKQSGDGSSTATVLTHAILEEGMKYTDISPMELKRSLEACVPLIEESINKQKREITVDEVGAVASISAEDPEIGALIQEIYQQIGKEGIIHWDISKTTKDSYTIGSGITVEGATYYSPYMCDATENGQNTNQIRLANPKVLITRQKISSVSEFESIAMHLNSKSIKDLVVFCDDVDPLVIPNIIKTRMTNGFRVILIKMPVLWKGEWFEDLALASGAKIVDPGAGLPMKDLKPEHLGTFSNILVTKEDTFIDGIADLTEHIKELEAEAVDEATNRAARLNTKTARLFIGAQSDSALSYKRLKVEDAISASYQALNGGIVAGGGVALLNASNETSDTVGGMILKEALKAPFKQIVSNAGIKTDVETHGKGIDTRTGEIVDMFEAQIIDPANIVINAVKNAVSVAASILTVQTLVLLPREEKATNTPPIQV